MQINQAVIPAAGNGSRLGAITRATAKELVPLVDRPAIDWVLDEAVTAGMERICVVVSPRKKPLLEAQLADVDAEVTFVVQHHPLGLGHAVLQAADWAGHDGVAVLLPDDVILGDNILARLAATSERTGRSTIGLSEVPAAEVHRYGTARIGVTDGGVLAIDGMVEKPAPGTEPSRLTVSGRYVLGPEIWGILEALPAGYNGEIQLTDALDVLARQHGLDGLVTVGERHDLGNPLSWLKANVAFGIEVHGSAWLGEVPAAQQWAERARH